MRRRSFAAGVVVSLTPLTGCVDDTERSGDESSTGGGAGDVDPSVFDQENVEPVFLDYFNEMRAEEGIREARLDNILSEMGQEHAENMAEHDYIGHTQPDGTTIEERYRQHGILGRCELDIPGTNQFYPGAENAAGAAMGRVTHDGTDETYTVISAESLSEFLMSSWMSSEGHRQVMTLQTVSSIGLGIATSGRDIYAALQFC